MCGNVFLLRAVLLIFCQSINKLYLFMVVINAEKLMGLIQKKEEIQNYYYYCTVLTNFLHTKVLQVIKN